MAKLSSKFISEGVDDILTVDGGLTASLKPVEDGDGVDSKLQLSTTQVRIVANADVTPTEGTGSLVIGSGTTNIGIDGNEILARNSAGVTELIVSNEGGGLRVGSSSYTITGETDTSSVKGGMRVAGMMFTGNGTVNGRYYMYVDTVASGGSDSNSGRSSSSPLANIHEAIKRAPSGCTVYVTCASGTSGSPKIYYWKGGSSQDYNQNKDIVVTGSNADNYLYTEIHMGRNDINATSASPIYLRNTKLRMLKVKIKLWQKPTTVAAPSYDHGVAPMKAYYGTSNVLNLGTWRASAAVSVDLEFMNDLGEYVNDSGNTVTTGFNCLCTAEQSTIYVNLKQVKTTAFDQSTALDRPNNIVQCTGDGQAVVTYSGGSHSKNLCLINDKGAAQFHIVGTGGGIYKRDFDDGQTVGDTAHGYSFRSASSWAARQGVTTGTTQF